MPHPYNVYEDVSESYGDMQIKEVWWGFPEKLPVGITVDSITPGKLYPAGTPLVSADMDQTCSFYRDGVDDPEDVIGLLWNDIYSTPDGKNIQGTACVVTKGTIRAKLLNNIPDLTDDVKAALKERITFYNETTIA